MTADPTPAARDDLAAGVFDGDTGTLPPEARWVLTRLLGDRTVTAAHRGPVFWDALLAHRDVLTSRLHDLYLELVVDPVAQVAYKVQLRPDGVSYRVLLKEVSYSREATALLLFLREIHFQQTQAGQTAVRVTRQLMEHEMTAFIHVDETDLKRRAEVIREAINTLVTQTVLVPVTGHADSYEISPVIEPLLPAAAIQRVADWLTRPTAVGDLEAANRDRTDEEWAVG